MDLWEMSGLSPRQGILLTASGLLAALVVALAGFLRRARAERGRGLHLDDR